MRKKEENPCENRTTDGSLEPLAPNILRKIEWIIRFGKNHKLVLFIAFLLLIGPIVYSEKEKIWSVWLNVFPPVSPVDWLPELEDGIDDKIVILAAWPNRGLPREKTEAEDRNLLDVPFHFLVTNEGVREGRALSLPPAMVRGFNIPTIGIAVVCENWTPNPVGDCTLGDGTKLALERLLSLFAVKMNINPSEIIGSNWVRDRAYYSDKTVKPLPEKDLSTILQSVTEVSRLSFKQQSFTQ